jgi:hypothetical protein
VREVQDLAVPDALRGEGAGRFEHGPVGTSQHPPARGRAGVREVLTRVPEQPGQQLGERGAFRQCEVDPAGGRRDGHPDQACGVHVALP